MSVPSKEVDIVGLIASLPGVGACIYVWRYARRNRALIRKLDKLINEHERVLASMEGRPANLIDIADDDT